VNTVEFYVNIVNAIVSRHKPHWVCVWIYRLDEAIILNARWGNNLNKPKPMLRYNYSLVMFVTYFLLQYSLLGRTAASIHLTRLCAREDYIESCRRESFKTYFLLLSWFLILSLKHVLQGSFVRSYFVHVTNCNVFLRTLICLFCTVLLRVFLIKH
jgi:hypothetical protein